MDYKYIITIEKVKDNRRQSVRIELDNLNRLYNVYNLLIRKEIPLLTIGGKTYYTSPYIRTCPNSMTTPRGRVHIIYEYLLQEKTQEQLKKEKEEIEDIYYYVPISLNLY